MQRGTGRSYHQKQSTACGGVVADDAALEQTASMVYHVLVADQ